MKKTQIARCLWTVTICLALAAALASPVGAALAGKTIEVLTGVSI